MYEDPCSSTSLTTLLMVRCYDFCPSDEHKRISHYYISLILSVKYIDLLGYKRVDLLLLCFYTSSQAGCPGPVQLLNPFRTRA